MTKFGRVILFVILSSYLIAISIFFDGIGNLFNGNHRYTVLISYTITIILVGAFLLEPYFSKPVDIISRSLASLIVIISYDFTDLFKFILIVYFILLIVLCFILILSSTRNKIINVLWYLIEKIGSTTTFVAIFYVAIFYQSYDTIRNTEFALFFIFFIAFIYSSDILKFITTILSLFKIENSKCIGHIIGSKSPDIFILEIKDESINNTDMVLYDGNSGIIFRSVNLVFGINKTVMELSLIKCSDYYWYYKYKDDRFHKKSPVSIAHNDPVYIINKPTDKFPFEDKEYIGYVNSKSNINNVYVELFQYDETIFEGTILQSRIGKENVLFQVVDGVTEIENRKVDEYGYINLVMRKLGKISNGQIKGVEWLPNIYSLVTKPDWNSTDYSYEKNIGKLPHSSIGISIENHENIITHNTAILGILGIGKSRLTYELIQKCYNNTNAKFIIIDLTNQYSKDLTDYVDDNFYSGSSDGVITEDEISELKTTTNRSGSPDKFSDWGNINLYKELIGKVMRNFINVSDKKIYINNPDKLEVTKAATQFKIKETIEITPAEKTRIISEIVYNIARENGESDNASICIVYEEAHSLIPEFSSAASTSDSNASNGTARVILQGRKYGLGSIVITQRTANISKSVLNQCNTIFSLRMFDDTGKKFLDNYFGNEYSNLLPRLKERHAVVFGKGLGLKQPVIVQLNDMNDVILKNNVSSESDKDEV